MNIGYACINMQLSYPQKWGGKEKGIKPITTGRSMIKRTFDTKGVDYASEITLQNCKDLDRIIDWLHIGQKKTHKQVVDYLNEYNLNQGHKRFNFVYAAFSYDLGDYHKDLVDDISHGYFGNNAIR